MKSLFSFIAAVTVVAFTASRFRPGAWYEALARPRWTLPNWLFAPVWIVLYVAIAVAGWLVWRAAPSSRVHVALVAWVVQLILNASWSWLFFGLHQPGYALLDILLLVAAIVLFVVAAGPVSALAAWLFIPYLLWVGFATALNTAIWHLNRATT